jgi:hypothetical protein
MDVCAFACRKMLTPTEVDRLEKDMVEALHLLELNFPASIMTITVHNMLHLPWKIRNFGPLHITAMWPYERLNRAFKDWIASKVHPAASLMQNAKAFRMLTLYQATHSGVFSHRQDALFEQTTTGFDSILSAPWEADADGNWPLDTGNGRFRVLSTGRVKVASDEYMQLHLYHCCHNQQYGDAWERCMTSAYLPTLPRHQHPKTARDGTYHWHSWSYPQVSIAAPTPM